MQMEALNRKSAEMRKRIRQLEDALRISHGLSSTAPHPLLSEELLAVKNTSKGPVSTDGWKDSVDSDLLNAIGTLSISDEGSESYVGGPDVRSL